LSNNPKFPEYPAGDKRIKKGNYSPEGYVIVAADYFRLEPVVLQEVSECDKVIQIYQKEKTYIRRLAI